MPSNVSSQEIFNAQNADEFLRCGFEVVVSNSKNNDTQNITGIAINGDGDAEEAFAGGLYVQSEKTLSGGYAANGLHNLNTPYMQLAEGGTVEGKPGDHTGIYACNTYDVNKLSDGGLLIINFPGKTLGLITPAGERTDYTELIVGEQYKFGEVNFANADISGLADGDVVEIENGVFKKGSLDSVEAGYVYGKVHEFRAFTEGACHGTMGVIVKICRKAGGGGSGLPDVTVADDGKYLVADNGTWGASDGRIADYTLSDDLQAIINGIVLPMASSLMADYKWHRASGHIGEDTRPDDYEELIAEIRKCTSATTGSINGNPIRAYFMDTSNMKGYEFYALFAQLGLIHVLVMFDDYQSSVDVIVYARREEVAS